MKTKPGFLAGALLIAAGGLFWPVAGHAQDAGADAMQRRAALEQKMSFANQVLFQTPSARRVLASDHADAKQALGKARELYAGARASIEAGNLTAAEDQVNEALRLAAQAKRLVPDREAGERQRLAVDRLLNEMQAFQASHLLSMRQIIPAPTGATRPPELEQLRELMTKAQTLTESGRHAEAWEVLRQAAALVVGAAPKLMAGRAGDYAPQPANPEKEFEFENARFHSYEDLVPIALVQASPGPERMREIEVLVEEGKRLHDQSRNLAVARDYRNAASFSQQATARIQQALRVAGVNLSSD